MGIVEIKCPRCNSPCYVTDKAKGEYRCGHCGAVFQFMDPTKRTLLRDTQLHNCPICGRPIAGQEGFTCTQCGKDYVCPKCIQEVAGRFVCKDCLRQKWIVVGPSWVCPNCNGAISYVPQYNRWYCNNCKQYVQHVCSRCGQNSRYIQSRMFSFQSAGWYCDNCRDYIYAKETQPVSAPAPAPQPIIVQTQPPPKSGCFIVTAAYGTPLADEVSVLREFRDRRLMRSSIGKRLMDLYYEVSPTIAGILARSEGLRSVVRLNLGPIIKTLKRRTIARAAEAYASTPDNCGRL